MASRIAAAVVVVLGLVTRGADGVTFELVGQRIKCLQEDVHKDVLVVGDYNIATENNPQQDPYQIDLEITDSRKHRVYFKEKATAGKFAFTADDYDTYDICINQHRDGKEIHGEAMELELRKLEDLAESIVNDFAEMKQREEKHRDTNESTNERMLLFSVFSMVCLLGLAIWQVMYLKKYFKQKKLI